MPDTPLLLFHLDMKVSQYRPEYLARLFPRLAALGYTHVVFEIEEKVRLDCIRGAEWCEAFTKAEFATILATARQAGLGVVPLIQTLGHLEWLLSHRRYHHLRECRESAMMLCPSKPESLDFLRSYLDEVGELFGNPEFVHLGADEAFHLGRCPACQARIAATSRSGLFLRHLETLARQALARGWRPMAWADMALQHPEALDTVPRELIWVDWDYAQGDDSPPSLTWPGHRRFTAGETLPPEFLQGIGRHALDEQGRFRLWCYSDYLIGRGFEVIVAPAMRSHGDHVFAPRFSHFANVAGGSARTLRSPQVRGLLLTSWAVRLHLLEAQWPGFAIPQLMTRGLGTRWAELETAAAATVLPQPDPDLFRAWEKLSPALPNAVSVRMFEMDTPYYGPADSLPHYLNYLRQEGQITGDLDKLEATRAGYGESQKVFSRSLRSSQPPSACLRILDYAARAMIVKADELRLTMAALDGRPDPAAAANLLLETEALRDEYRELLHPVYQPASVERELAMIFGSGLRHLARLANGRVL